MDTFNSNLAILGGTCFVFEEGISKFEERFHDCDRVHRSHEGDY